MLKVLNKHLRPHKAPGHELGLIIYVNAYSIKPTDGEEGRSQCADYLMDP